MSMTDPIGDMLTRIRNGQMARKTSIVTPASKQRQRVLDVLEREGFIRGYSRTDYDGGKADLQIELKYYEGEPVIQRIKRISTPGRVTYEELIMKNNSTRRTTSTMAAGSSAGGNRRSRLWKRRRSMFSCR